MDAIINRQNEKKAKAYDQLMEDRKRAVRATDRHNSSPAPSNAPEASS